MRPARIGWQSEPGAVVRQLVWLYWTRVGRLCRRDFWLWYGLPMLVLVTGLERLEDTAWAARHGWTEDYLVEAFLGLTAPFSMAVLAKRLHDRDRKLSTLWLIVVPLWGFFFLVWEIGFARGTAGANRFGADPLASQAT